MGFLYGGTCYAEKVDAQQAACDSHAATWGDGVALNVVQPAAGCAQSDVYLPLLWTRIEAGSTTTSRGAPIPVFQACDYGGGVDFAMTWVYLVLPVLAMVWGLRKLAAMFDGERGAGG